MSYIRKKRKGNTVQLYEVRSIRKGKKVRQEFIRYIGVEKETEDGTKIVIPAHKNLLDRIVLTENVHLGNVFVLYQIAEELNIANVINRFSIKGGGLPSGIQIVLMAINHTINPTSFNRFASWYEDTALPQITGIKPIKLNKDNLCSAMDGICREIKNEKGEVIRTVDKTLDICKELIHIWTKRYNLSLDALYYDITSTYFEGAKCILAKLGYSRDNRKGKLQINIALVVTRKWRFPICFIVYSGDTSDQKTVKNILKIIRKEFGIMNCTMIWDRGMVSKTNMRQVDSTHQKIVCGLKGSEVEIKKILLSVRNEELLKKDILMRKLNDDEGIYAIDFVRKIYGKHRKIVVYLNTLIQKQTREKREFKLRSARIKLGKYKKKLETGNYTKIGPVTNHVKECVKGVSKYFKPIYHQNNNNEKITLDWIEHKDKIKESKELDGKFALMSTNLDMSCQEIVDAYFEKDDIEKAFRFMKQVTKLHPTRCWLENRVRVHVLICYLAYLLSKVLEYKLRTNGLKLTAEMTLEELGKIKQGVLIDPTTKYSVIKVARLSKIQKEIINRLGLSGYINSES